MRLIPGPPVNEDENGLAVYIAAHPDDWDIEWGGQIIKNDVGRHPILLIIVTDGAADFSNHNWDVKHGSYKADLEIQTVHTPNGDRQRWFSRNLMNKRLASVKCRATYLKIRSVFTLNFPDSLAQHFISQIAQDICDIICRAVDTNNYALHLVCWHAGRKYSSNAWEHRDHMAAGDATAIAIQDVMLKLGLDRLGSRFTTVYGKPQGTLNPVEYEAIDSVWSERLKLWEMMWEHSFLESSKNLIFPEMLKLGLDRLGSRFTTIYGKPQETLNPVEYEAIDSAWSERLRLLWEMMWEHSFLEPSRNPMFPENPEPYVNYTFTRPR